jgi:Flp pilus assembly pilin Flp
MKTMLDRLTWQICPFKIGRSKIARSKFWRDCRAQDLVEFALLAGLVAVASGLLMPNLRTSMDTIYSRIASKLVEAGG